MHLSFICVASNSIGFGHLSRCINLCRSSVDLGIDCDLTIFTDSLCNSQVEKLSFPYSVASLKDLVESNFSFPYSTCMIVDIIYTNFVKKYDTIKIFSHFKLFADCLIAIDSLGSDSIYHSLPKLPLDILVSPYVASFKRKYSNECEHWYGPELALLPPIYSQFVPPRVFSNDDNKILITCGGSDPYSYSIKILNSLAHVDKYLEIKLVLGPFFNSNLLSAIRSYTLHEKHTLELVDKPSSLLSLMDWCDISISPSGLTKYELAARGVPSIIFSIDDLHHHSNSEFNLIETSLYIGTSPTAENFSRSIVDLLNDKMLRRTLSENGQIALDGLGNKRFLAKISNYVE